MLSWKAAGKVPDVASSVPVTSTPIPVILVLDWADVFWTVKVKVVAVRLVTLMMAVALVKPLIPTTVQESAFAVIAEPKLSATNPNSERTNLLLRGIMYSLWITKRHSHKL